MQYALERARIVMLVETSRMETENVAIEQELMRNDQWPPPWHAEDAEVRALEQQARDEAEHAEQMEVAADEFLEGTVQEDEVQMEQTKQSYDEGFQEEARGQSDEEDFLLDDSDNEN